MDPRSTRRGRTPESVPLSADVPAPHRRDAASVHPAGPAPGGRDPADAGEDESHRHRVRSRVRRHLQLQPVVPGRIWSRSRSLSEASRQGRSGVEPTALTPFAAWENFYVIVGSSAAALTGLQFVVIVLGVEINRPGSGHATSAFGTPTVVHFSAVLLNSAILSAPWRTVSAAGLAIAGFALFGVAYAPIVLRRTLRQKAYVPVLEDW